MGSDAHTCEALVVTCIDFRIQRAIDTWLKETLGGYVYDRVAVAGGVYDRAAILQQVAVSSRLHRIHRVLLVNHEDCGAYGAEGTPQRHRQDLQRMKELIGERFPSLRVEMYYVLLDGTVQHVRDREHGA